MTTVIALANQKGGVGKTTTAINLSAAIADLGNSVLLLDLDPQANATAGLGLEAQPGQTSYELLLQELTVEQSVLHTECEGLFVVPSSPTWTWRRVGSNSVIRHSLSPLNGGMPPYSR